MVDNDELSREIESLKKEMRALSTTFLNLRNEDIRQVLGDQTRSVLLERLQRYTASRIGKKHDEFVQISKSLERLIIDNIEIFKRDGAAAAYKHWKDFQDGPFSSMRNGLTSEDRTFAEGILGQIKDYINVSTNLLNPLQKIGPIEMAGHEDLQVMIAPEEIEEAIAPLASAWRIKILSSLMEDVQGLTELGKRLGLKKGHIQFHLRVLISSKLVDYDRRTKLYRLTEKGRVAYMGAIELARNIGS